MKNIYFAGAIKGNEEFVASQEFIIKKLRENKIVNQVFSERSPDYEPFDQINDEADIFDRDLKWLFNSDAIVAEISGESFGTGWEIAYAQKVQRIPVLCLINENVELPDLIRGNSHSGLIIGQYSNKNDIIDILREFVSCLDNNDLEQISNDDKHTDTKKSIPTEEILIGKSKKVGLKFASLLNLEHTEEYKTGKQCSHYVGKNDISGFYADSATDLFKQLIESLKQGGISVLLAEGSKPSTDLGWATCFAQWNNIWPILFYKANLDVSWLLTGQASYNQHESEETNWLEDPNKSLNTMKFEPRTSSHFSDRPRAVPLPYSDQDDLTRKIEDIFDKIFDRQNINSSQQILKKYSVDQEEKTINNFAREHNITKRNAIIAEALLRNTLWPIVTVSGINNTFLSGERQKLIEHLTNCSPVKNPKEYYKEISYLVNYEEKAFAKNIRALRDIGIIVNNNDNRNDQSEYYNQSSLDEFELLNEGLPDPISDKNVQKKSTFTNNIVALTEFGRGLSEYISNHPASNLENFLIDNRYEIGESIESDLIDGLKGDSVLLMNYLEENNLNSLLQIVEDNI